MTYSSRPTWKSVSFLLFFYFFLIFSFFIAVQFWFCSCQRVTASWNSQPSRNLTALELCYVLPDFTNVIWIKKESREWEMKWLKERCPIRPVWSVVSDHTAGTLAERYLQLRNGTLARGERIAKIFRSWTVPRSSDYIWKRISDLFQVQHVFVKLFTIPCRAETTTTQEGRSETSAGPTRW